jgi:hypothetical protein
MKASRARSLLDRQGSRRRQSIRRPGSSRRKARTAIRSTKCSSRVPSLPKQPSRRRLLLRRISMARGPHLLHLLQRLTLGSLEDERRDPDGMPRSARARSDRSIRARTTDSRKRHEASGSGVCVRIGGGGSSCACNRARERDRSHRSRDRTSARTCSWWRARCDLTAHVRCAGAKRR